MRKIIRYINSYGVSLFVVSAIFRKISNKSKFYNYILNLKHKLILQRIKKSALETMDEISVKSAYNPANNIWMMWWQGEESFPAEIKCCINSIKRNSPGWKVVVLTKYNYSSYLALPSYIEERVNNGEMSLTHLCDYLRFAILHKHGGLWIDSSVYATRPLMIKALDKYWTYRQPEKIIPCISHCRWSGILVYMPKGHFFAEYMLRYYNKYWKSHKVIIDYFLVDYLTYFAYSYWKPFISEIQKVSDDNPDMFSFLPKLENVYDEDFIQEIVKFPFIKLKYKTGNIHFDKNGNPTLIECFTNGLVEEKLSKLRV